MDLLIRILTESVRMLYLAAPFLLLGLLMAGFLHVLMPTRWVERWLGRPGLSGVIKAALVGVPLPICSCGVVPIAVELRRKKASDPASLSFLTTTPESGVDSILFTWALMGPVMAIVRPLAAFATALVTGMLAIAYLPISRLGRVDGEDGPTECSDAAEAAGDGPAHEHEHDHHEHGHHGHDHEHGHDHDHGLGYAESESARAALITYVRSWFREPAGKEAGGEAMAAELSDEEIVRQVLQDDQVPEKVEADPEGDSEPEKNSLPTLWRPVVRPSLRYGFAELFDELAFWLVAGILLAGVLSAVLPADLDALGLGSGIVPMLVMLGIGVPLYVCASASTPIAAALMMKGLSPGAALVFLLAGPATNAASLLVLGRSFGRRFVQIYLAGVIIGSLTAGLALDGVVSLFGWRLDRPLLEAQSEDLLGPVGILSFAVILYLLFASAGRGAMASGWADLRASLGGLAPAHLWRIRRRVVVVLAVLGLLAWLATGFLAVPPEAQGYPMVFGALDSRSLSPGLHWHWPAPMGRVELRRQNYPRKADIGYSTDMAQFAQIAVRSRFAPSEEWHSPVASMRPDPEQASYLTADENLLEMSFSVHYSLTDPAAFFYGVDHSLDFIELYAEGAARRRLAGRRLEDLFTVDRPSIEEAIRTDVQHRLDALRVGVRIDGVHLVDIHPPGESVYWFRDVSSALDDKQMMIHQARRQEAERLPLARGEAVLTVAVAEAEAEARVRETAGEVESFDARSEVLSRDREILKHLLWLEASEKHLAGRDKVLVPAGSTPRGVTLWRPAPGVEP